MTTFQMYIIAAGILLALVMTVGTWFTKRKVTYFYHITVIQGTHHSYEHGLVRVPSGIPPKELMATITSRACESMNCTRDQVDVNQLNRV